MIVIKDKLNKRTAPVNNTADKSNVTGTVIKGFAFESVSTTTNALGIWYKDRDGYYYWGGGVKQDTTAVTPIPVNSFGLTPDNTCINFIKEREGLRLHAYQDSAGIWTIGYGTILYENNTPVKKGDTITTQDAEYFLAIEIAAKSKKVNALLTDVPVNQQQYDALVSFAYNVGTGALMSSTLLKRVKANPDDPVIRAAFMMWDKARVDGQLVTIEGLKKRRADEADLYFS